MSDLMVRPLSSADQAQWSALWSGYNAFYGRLGATALSDAINATTWSRLLDPAEPVLGFVAEKGGALVGLAHVVLHRSTIQVQDNCYLQDLFVDDAVRGAGVGRALIEAVYAFARTQGLPKVYWQTQEANATARRLYDTLAAPTGFIVYRKVLAP
ncbi:GNAT family N-acetyltransferase [Lysobacter sp. KIS68-7]|uniref:GNAT family N-acetyltransferase n=1 Tax=Lysobacter sp. KIS68-7 TaxID=2904252 RepID=UPI001E46AE33|nr:GNAT family N-acetyltransferase [Lysobacter sp. KIS68-7]UHQ19841.1 GNAT family N-acetyltransferase [Lysobacter sp. KIS68-7]